VRCGLGRRLSPTVVLPWPQPNGVFSTNASGTTFNPIPFLTTLRDIYETVVLGDRRNDEALELGIRASVSAPTAPFSSGCTPNLCSVHVPKDCLSRRTRGDSKVILAGGLSTK
jgi:hypothetical protein